MNRTTLVVVAKNMMLLAALALPLFFALVWLQALFNRGEGATDVGGAVEAGGVYYLANVVPVTLGGLIHQVLWVLLPRGWSQARRRIVAFASSPLIPLAVLLSWGGSAAHLMGLAMPMVLALAAYALVLRLPPDGPAEERRND